MPSDGRRAVKRSSGTELPELLMGLAPMVLIVQKVVAKSRRLVLRRGKEPGVVGAFYQITATTSADISDGPIVRILAYHTTPPRLSEIPKQCLEVNESDERDINQSNG